MEILLNPVLSKALGRLLEAGKEGLESEIPKVVGTILFLVWEHILSFLGVGGLQQKQLIVKNSSRQWIVGQPLTDT